jgi:phage terminase large subunit GpA-like protein
MSSYKGISSTDKQRVVSALKSRGAGACPRCDDSQWTVSEFSRIDVQETSGRNGHTTNTTIPAVMIVCQHCGFIAQHALQPLGLWNHEATIEHGASGKQALA